MINIHFKSYIIGKKVERDYCEDAWAVNLDCTRFAVADGVSNSFRPELVSSFLVKEFVENNIAVVDWSKQIGAETGRKLEKSWKEGVKNFLNRFEGFGHEIQELRLQSVGAGASTFCGVVINTESNSLDYAILGDSCLFIINDGGKYDIYTSCEKHKEGKGWIVDFPDTTACIQVGNYESASFESWRIGSTTLQTGYILLMTDGVSKWFLQELSKGRRDITEYLWNVLDNHEEFTNYVVKCRQEGSPLSDDITILMIKVTQTEDTQSEQSDKSIYKEDLEMSDTVEDTSEASVNKKDKKDTIPNSTDITENAEGKRSDRFGKLKLIISKIISFNGYRRK